MPTIADVAREAGVSIATVSRVLNNTAGTISISAATQARVRNAVLKLGYLPNAAARHLSSGKSLNLAVVPFRPPGRAGSFRFPALYLMPAWEAISMTTEKAGYMLTLCPWDTDADEPTGFLRGLHQHSFDGAFFMGGAAQQHVRQLEERGIPAVFVDYDQPESRLDAVVADSFMGVKQSVEYLITLGHRRILFLEGTIAHPTFQNQANTYSNVMRESGLVPWVAQEDAYVDGGYRAARSLLQTQPLPTAIVASNDWMAIGVLKALNEAGFHVPGDISLAGFDDNVAATMVHPEITTVRVDFAQMGKVAAEIILTRLKGDVDPLERQKVCLPVTFVLRASTGPPAIR
jgi:DNA-binding LacI/PurR family transcriptional regulator